MRAEPDQQHAHEIATGKQKANPGKTHAYPPLKQMIRFSTYTETWDNFFTHSLNNVFCLFDLFFVYRARGPARARNIPTLSYYDT